jgi:hypothetical protein
MLKHVLLTLNLFAALIVVALLIAFAGVLIPIALACFVGFILFLWWMSHLVEGGYFLWCRLKRFLREFD